MVSQRLRLPGILVGNERYQQVLSCVKALDNVNLKVRPHSIHALMGKMVQENRIIKMPVWYLSKDSGTILFQGKEIDFHS